MDRVADLRHKAGLYKRLAEIRTSGGHSTDLLLIRLADELDREGRRARGPICAGSTTRSR